jgi:hypothetical protein
MADEMFEPVAEGIDSAVMGALQWGGLDGDNLKELVSIVSTINKTGLRPFKVFPKGIPAPDGVWVHTFVPLDRTEALITLLRSIERIDVVRLFPKGIPRPDILVAEIGIR